MKKFNLPIELRKTVPWRMVLIFILFSIAIILGGFFFYKMQRDRILMENQNSLAAISTLKILQMELWRKERIANAVAIRNNGPLIRSVKQFLNNENKNILRGELLKWMESVRSGYDYDGVLILDTLLKVRMSTSKFDSVISENIRDQITTAINNHTIVITDLYMPDSSNRIHLDIILPLIESGDNLKPFGALILRIDPNKSIFPLIQLWPTSSKSAETLIIRKDSDKVVFLNELRHQQNRALNLRQSVTRDRLLGAMAVLGKRGMVEGIDYRNVEVVGYLSSIPDFNWFMVAKIDKEEIQAPLKRYFVITILFCVVLILINASVFVFFIWNQRVKMYRMMLKDEQAIRESEEKFNIAFLMSPVSVTISTIYDNKFVDINNAFLRDMEFTREEVIGKTAHELDIWGDESERLWVINELAEKHKIFGKVISYKSKTGKIIYGLTSMSVVKVNGQPCNISSAVNITESRNAENAIIESESKLREAQNMAHLGFWKWDIKTGNVEWSDEVFRIFCLNPDEFTPQIDSILKLSPWPEDNQRDKELINRSIETHSPGSYEQRFLRPDNSIGHYHSTFQGRYDENGDLLSIVGTVLDITERKRAEEMLRETENKFRQTFELSPVGIVMVGLDKKFLHCNNSFSNSLGYTVDELVGKTISDVTFPEDQGLGMNEMAAIVEGRLESAHFQKRYVRTDRSIVWGDVLISLVRDNAGNPQYFLAIIQDITENKLAENEIRLQSEIMGHMGEAVYLVRLSDGIIVFANKGFEMMFGYKQGEMIGKHVSIVNAPTEKSPDETATEIIKTLKKKGLWVGEVQNIKKDGTHFWTHANVTVFDLPQFGEVLISVQKDITEQKNAEQQIKNLNEVLEEKVIQRTGQLEAVNKELEAFSYSVSHDLRAPLRSVHGYTKILLDEYQDKLDDEGKRICKIITTSATQMGGLIDDLLSFSRIGRSTLNPSSIDMKKMVRLLFEGMILPVERERIQLTIGKLQKSYGDVALIGQVWINLLSNAIKYSSKKEVTEISIGSEVKAGMVTYFIKDNGVGFDMQYVHKLFGVFQRLHSEREFEGNGVGLAIIQRIILKHGGKVWAEGEAGKGATFYFSLPVIGAGKRQK
jgi:PAS domain S-box-containing protein